MSRYNERFNSSGCYDPTAYAAIERATLAEERKKQRQRQIKSGDIRQIYIASPYKGDTKQNVKNALRYCRFAVKSGYFPIAPHCYLPRFMDDSDPVERELALEFGLKLMKNCRELWVFGDRVSDGMYKEIKAARQLRIKVRYFDDDMNEVFYAD